MKRITYLFCALYIICLPLYGQISYGGKPLPVSLTRSMGGVMFEEMPSFDVAEELRIDSLNGENLRNSFRFAYKFMTDFTPGNSGTTFTLMDGTRVWRLGIRSAGAYSINVLFTEFEIPEGARLFLYNRNQTHILGAFTHRNNSTLDILPVSPVDGEEIIIEYQEPAGVDFAGRLRVGEVNHAYRSLRDKEPGSGGAAYNCMLSPSCFPDDPVFTDELGRSAVLLLVDGQRFCSGVMINNTDNDGKPYLLTAAHCINNTFQITDPAEFHVQAGRVITFFNFSSPLCNSDKKPLLLATEEMSMSSSTLKAINGDHDMALLELLETPPASYQPYYAGWSLAEEPEAPYFNVHHPGGMLKRVSWADDITLVSFRPDGFDFAEDAHWHVKKWTNGSTAGGSSGSPLFDTEGRIIGALTGGGSSCNRPENDYFYAFHKAWEPEEDKTKQLKNWLNPSDKNVQEWDGLNPYKTSDLCLRLSNVRENGVAEEIEVVTLPSSDNIPLYGNNTYGDRFVEAYEIRKASLLHGVYLITPSVGNSYEGLEVEICVYGGKNKPEELLHTEIFKPHFTDWDVDEQAFTEREKTLSRSQETFVRFSDPVKVGEKFYVGYHIKTAPEKAYFTAFNLPEKETNVNTTWLYYENKWIEATAHPQKAMATSLFVDPVVQGVDITSNRPLIIESQVLVVLSADRGSLQVILPDGVKQGKLAILDMRGRVLQTNELRGQQENISLRPNLSGVYLLRITYDDKQEVKKVLF